MHKENFPRLEQKLLKIAEDYHKKFPQSPGIPVSDLLQLSSLQKDVFDFIVSSLIREGKLVERKGRLALPGHREVFSVDEQKLIETVESLFANKPFNPPSFDEVVELTRIDAKKLEKIIKILIEQQRIVRIEGDIYFHSQAIEKARQILISHIKKEGQLESVKFKYLLDTSRKFAIPLLDYFDRTNLTRRDGYTRYLR